MCKLWGDLSANLARATPPRLAITDAMVTDIGDGFVMDDYRMVKRR